MWDMHDNMGFWMAISGVWWLAVIGLAVYFIATFSARQPGERQHAEQTAAEIARRRYASGEISKEEFERIRHDLTEGT